MITGDRVEVRADGSAAFEPGPGRSGIRAFTSRAGGHLHVLPMDAEPLVRAGRVDARLFDVTGLIQLGYDDRRKDLPLIVTTDGNQATNGSRATARSTVLGKGAEVVRELPAVGGLAVRAERSELSGLWQGIAEGAGASGLRGGISTVWLDGLRQPVLDRSVPQIGAPAAWQAGLDGTGVKVAVLDTGVDASHPDLAGQVVARANFTEGAEDDKDRVGHGTHVASTIAGTGAASAGRYRGGAPGADLLDGKVCAQDGCYDSGILAGMQWAVEQGAAVVNMSFGAPDGPEIDPVEQAVQTLTEQHGTLFVVSAGNRGRDESISSPAGVDAALAVGAVDGSDNLAPFSSRGPRVGDGGLKPDVTAPGVDIVAARSPDGLVGQPGEPYVTMEGTSMAAPHVAGAAAILAQRHPQWRSAELKSTLMGSAAPNPGLDAYAQGAGRVDVARAIGQTVSADPPSVGFGRQLWPHDDDVPIAKEVTYRNGGTEPVTLALTVQATGPGGAAAPAGAFTVSPSTVTVPAGGTARVTVTADTRFDGPDGRYSGQLVGTAGQLVVRTPFGVERESEAYEMTVSHLDRSGAATGNYRTTLDRLDGPPDRYNLYDADGTATIRLPKGRYLLSSFVRGADPENPEMSLLAQPLLDLSRPVTVGVDARRAGPVSVTVPNPDATLLFATVGLEMVDDTGERIPIDVLSSSFTGLYTGRIDGSAPVAGFAGEVSSLWAKTDAEGDDYNSPFQYNLAWAVDGTLPAGFTRNVRHSELATVPTRYARNASGAGIRGWSMDFPSVPGLTEHSWAQIMRFDLPFERTEYYNTEGGVLWEHEFAELQDGEFGEEELSGLRPPPVRHRAGKVVRANWNHAVFGPTLASPRIPETWDTRLGDTLSLSSTMFGDGDGRPGFARTESAKLTLYRNGVKHAESDRTSGDFEVPPATADYRVEAIATRGAPTTLSTRVEAAWMFRSGHVPGDTPVRLPLHVLRFSPALDGYNVAPAGRRFTVPVSVQAQPGSVTAPIRSVTVDVSYDDGVTWHRATVAGSGADRQVTVTHPEGPGFVSFRATATDRAGNSVRQTVIRAYQIKP
ncbi:S8 family serine peptidase [Plantactinospora endophytica]|uniref:S8 family serine peptidase n=1 Tax=Plantactinospora endophytica TaxID=673535 RepID=UPI001EF16969|nr:S8 family serine peptidase [Plantactinospora endophytica]